MRGVSGELEDENWRLGSTTLVRGVSGELEDENWRLGSTTPVRGVSGELEDENWRRSTTLVRGVAEDDPQGCPSRRRVASERDDWWHCVCASVWRTYSAVR